MYQHRCRGCNRQHDCRWPCRNSACRYFGRMAHEQKSWPCSEGCPGWAVFNEDDLPEIQRCDDCDRFPSDAEAAEAARAAGYSVRAVYVVEGRP